MGLKKTSTDQTSDPKKRRRVGFASTGDLILNQALSFDVGVEANDCIKIYLVSCKEELGDENSFVVDPIDLNQFFGDDGRIYGYKNLKVKVWLSSISFRAYVQVSYDTKADGGKGITLLTPALEKIFGESIIEKEDEFRQSFSTESHYIKAVISNGEVMRCEATTKHNNVSNNQLESEAFTIEHQVIRMGLNNMPVGELYSRLVSLVLLLVDGCSPLDITDPRWEIYFVVEKKTVPQADVSIKLLGFAIIYRFFHYPDSSRLRISQILVLPPCQGQGHGRHLLEVINSVSISENMYDMTVEEPSDELQQVRTCIDVLRLLAFEPIKLTITSISSKMKHGKLSKMTYKVQFDPPENVIEDVRKTLKINKKQFLQCWEILIYLNLDPNDCSSMDNYRLVILERTRANILGKDSGSAGKQIIEVPNDYDHEMTFVMFGPKGRIQNTTEGETEETKTNREQQLRELSEERMKEIMQVAEKVSLLRV
ncbi:hypothetical protein GIB67_036548 [Kingdonia uniflora]|uniref:histone acetyltransferase n=1 Tax=Kingdonia uniflora TaxID=39325 RepID=A0A7J7P097_9MAGN|nr:hypothetical protein GIB67_036548 [Kingdonia uniflora]